MFRLISFSELLAFESLLCSADAQYRIAFQLFDLDGKGSVSFGEFVDMFSEIVNFSRKVKDSLIGFLHSWIFFEIFKTDSFE